MTPQETDPDLPVNVQESLAEAWVGGGRPWPAAGLGALSAAVHKWDLLKEIVIIFITSATVSVQFNQSCLTFCDPMDCSTPGLPVHHQLSEFTQTNVHWVGDAIPPSHPLSSPSPPAFNLSQHQGLFK